ncbi:MAG: hypothetical protein HY706_19400, partial [Candidatus Hydrogenedentes bacterium]|nr:hypothetical protein [Candidatus Hydrogenedentota bacterium]
MGLRGISRFAAYAAFLAASVLVLTVPPQLVRAFQPPPPTEFALSVTVEPSTGGTVTPDPDAAGGTAPQTPTWVETYAGDAFVTLTANPITGWRFGNWSGDLSGTVSPVVIQMNANKSVTATFVPEVWFQTATSSAAESAGTVNITVNRTNAASSSSANYTVSGTASGAGIDHNLANGQVSFASGETSRTIAVPIVNDTLDEDDETVIVTLSNPTNAALATPSVHTLTITDNDPLPTVQFQASTSNAAEAAGTVNVAVTLNTASGRSVAVNYTVGGTATGGGTDHSLANGQVTFTAGQTSKNIAVPIINDTLDEDNETVVITLSSPSNATLGATTVHTLTITDDDNPPTVQFQTSTSSYGETSGTINVPVTLSAASGKTATVNYTVSGTATGGGVDHSLANGQLTFTAGQTSKNIAVTIINDALDEDNETVVITLSLPTNATLGATTVHTLTITDDDPLPTVQFQSSTSSGTEAAGTVNVAVTLSAASGRTVAVNYTVSGTATSGGTDHSLTNGQTSFTAGQTSRNIAVPIVNDALNEDNETVVITLSSPSNATLGATTVHTLTITDDDPLPTVQFEAGTSSANEFSGTVYMGTNLTPVSGRSVTVNYGVTGTATGGGVDYTLANGQLTFTAGQTSKTLSVPIVNDVLDESDETVVVTLFSPTNSTLGSPNNHTLTILDNDVVLTTAVQGSGTVAPSTGTYEVQTPIVLTATASQGWRFDHWEGSLTGSTNPANLTMDTDKSVTAVFIQTFHLNTLSFGDGTVSTDPLGPVYDSGAPVTLTATSGNGWRFDRWDGDLTGAQNPVTIAMAANQTIQGFFTREEYGLNTSSQGNGSIVRDPDGASYPYATGVSLSAVPAEGWMFDHWEGDIDEPDLYFKDNPTGVTMSAAKVLTAAFVEKVAVTVATVEGGTVTLDPPDGAYEPGTVIRVKAVPADHFVLERWGENVFMSEASPLEGQIVADAATTVSAVFAPGHKLTVVISPTEVDSQDPDRSYLKILPGLLSQPATKTLGRIEGFEKVGTSVQLQADSYPGGGRVFHHWEVDDVPLATANTLSLVMDADKTVTAAYVTPATTIVADVFGEGTLSFDDAPGETFEGKVVRPYATGGTAVVVYATPAENWVFDHWIVPPDWDYYSGHAEKSGRTGIRLTNTTDSNIAAVFIPAADAITYPADINGDGTVDAADVQLVTNAALGQPIEGNADVNATCGVDAIDVQLVINAALGLVGPHENTLITYFQGQGVVTYETLNATPDHPRYAYQEAFDHHDYAPREKVFVTAHPAPGWRFDHWMGALEGTARRNTIVVDRFREIAAVFVWPNQADLNDPDEDWVPNFREAELGTDPNQADSDGDGLPDWWEINHGLNPNSAGGNDG